MRNLKQVKISQPTACITTAHLTYCLLVSFCKETSNPKSICFLSTHAALHISVVIKHIF